MRSSRTFLFWLAANKKTFAGLMAKVALSHALLFGRLVAGVALGAGEGVNILIVEVALIA